MTNSGSQRSESSQAATDPETMVALWRTLNELYDDRFFYDRRGAERGKCGSDEYWRWSKRLAIFSAAQISAGVAKLLDREKQLPASKRGWPPNLIEFMALCEPDQAEIRTHLGRQAISYQDPYADMTKTEKAAHIATQLGSMRAALGQAPKSGSEQAASLTTQQGETNGDIARRMRKLDPAALKAELAEYPEDQQKLIQQYINVLDEIEGFRRNYQQERKQQREVLNQRERRKTAA